MSTSNRPSLSQRLGRSSLRPPTAQNLEEAVRKATAFRAAMRDLTVAPERQGGPAERRRDRRYPVRVSVIFRCAEQLGFGCTSDVSLGGMFIETESPLPFGARVSLRFKAGGLAEPLDAPAVVRWVEPDRGMGVQFESVRPLVIWALQREIRAV